MKRKYEDKNLNVAYNDGYEQALVNVEEELGSNECIERFHSRNWIEVDRVEQILKELKK